MTSTRNHILQTSFTLFLQKSFKEVTLNEIVSATRLSKGAFYHYFASKEQLFVEVINTFYFSRMLIDFSKLSRNSLRQFYHEYIEEMRRLVADFRTFLNLTDAKGNLNYLTMMFDALKLFPGFRDKLRQAQQDELDAWTAIVQTARQKGEFTSPMTDDQVARAFIYLGDGIGLHLLLNGDFETIDRETLALWDTFYEELKD